MTFEDFVAQIAVMKPNSIDEEKSNQVTRLKQIIASPSYIAEEKVDGCRYRSFGGRFFSSDTIEKTNNFPHLADFFTKLNMPNLILDGEIHYPGKTSQFATRVTGSSPEKAFKEQLKYGPIQYAIWDILRTPRGTWLIDKPLKERRKILEQFYSNFIKGTSIEPQVFVPRAVIDNKQFFFEKIIAEGGEGIVLKNLDGFYMLGKRPAWQWVKMKQKHDADLFISGYDEPKRDYAGKQMDSHPYWKEVNGIMRPVTKYFYNNWIGAIELSAFVEGTVTKICTCSGIDEKLRAEISAAPQEYLNQVVRISFMELTEDGYPRHPRFESFHETKQADECIWNLA